MAVLSDFDHDFRVRQYLAQLNRCALFVPAMKGVTDTAGSLNSFNQVNDAGILVPDAAPSPSVGAAGNPNGTYSYYVTFYDSVRDVEGNPSAKSASVSPSSQQVTVSFSPITNEGTNTRVDKIRVYRNLDGGSVYHRIATVDSTDASYVDDFADTDIINNAPMTFTNVALSADTFGFVTSFRDRVFPMGPYNQIGGTDYDDMVWWSKTGQLDSFPVWHSLIVERGRNGIIRWGGGHGDNFYVFKDNAIYQWRWDTDPHAIYGDGFGRTVNWFRGTLNGKTVVNDNGNLYSMDANGIFLFAGGPNTTELAVPLKTFWDRINWTKKDLFHSVRTEDKIYFFVALDEDTEPHHSFVLDLRAIKLGIGYRWWVHKWDAAIMGSCRYYTGNGTNADTYGETNKWKAMVITKAGHTFCLDQGFRDGLAPFLGEEVFGEVRGPTGTTEGAHATIVTDTSGKFLDTTRTPNVDVVGLYVRFDDDDFPDAYEITAATATTFTFVGTGSAVPSGTSYTIGAIPEVMWASKNHNFNTYAKKSLPEVLMTFKPLGVNKALSITSMKDRMVVEDNVNSRNDDGAEHTADEDEVELNLGGDIINEGGSGHYDMPIGGAAFTYFQLKIHGSGIHKSTVDNPAVINSIGFRPTVDGEVG